jgi:hypothetical protein
MDLEKILFNSGDLFLPKSVKAFLEQYWIGDDTSLFYVTWWTFIHFVSGVLTGYLLFYFKSTGTYYWSGFLIHSVWELWQMIGKNTAYWTMRGQIDIGVDTVAFMIGMAAFKYM